MAAIMDRYNLRQLDTGIKDTSDELEYGSSISPYDRNIGKRLAPCKRCGARYIPLKIRDGRIESYICPNCETIKAPDEMPVRFTNVGRPILEGRPDRQPFIVETFGEDPIREAVKQSKRAIGIMASSVTGNQIKMPTPKISDVTKPRKKKDTDDKVLEQQGFTILETYDHTSL